MYKQEQKTTPSSLAPSHGKQANYKKRTDRSSSTLSNVCVCVCVCAKDPRSIESVGHLVCAASMVLFHFSTHSMPS